NVLVQRSRRPQVQTGKVEARGRDIRFREVARDDAWSLVEGHTIGILPVPLRGDADTDGEITQVLPDGSITVVHQLVAIVFEDLAEIIQLGPGFVTGGATKPVFAGEGGNPVRRLMWHQDEHEH